MCALKAVHAAGKCGDACVMMLCVTLERAPEAFRAEGLRIV